MKISVKYAKNPVLTAYLIHNHIEAAYLEALHQKGVQSFTLLRTYYFLGLAFAATSVTQFSPVRVAFYDVATKL